MGQKYIGLVRVSSEKQEGSGLGLLAGRDDIDAYIEANDGELVTVLEEVESGMHSNTIDRPILLRALALCKRHKAHLLIPKVDRLVRSTEVHTDIKRSGVHFVACDNPHANEFTLDILVAVAANEGREIRKRTRKGLKAYKDHKKVSVHQMMKLLIKHGQGVPQSEIDAASDKEALKALVSKYRYLIPDDAVEAVAGKLGSHLTGSRLTPEQQAKGRAKANARARKRSIETYEDLVPAMRADREAGLSLQAIANRLNADGERRESGARWTKVQVKRLLDRARAAG